MGLAPTGSSLGMLSDHENQGESERSRPRSRQGEVNKATEFPRSLDPGEEHALLKPALRRRPGRGSPTPTAQLERWGSWAPRPGRHRGWRFHRAMALCPKETARFSALTWIESQPNYKCILT